MLLQSEDCLNVLNLDFRPWPRVRYNEPASQNFNAKLEKDKMVERTELRRYEAKEDIEVYLPILMEVITLFGIAIHTSLERTMGKYLKAIDGVFRNELKDEWQLEKFSKLLCTNNAAERSFGVAKAYIKIYQTMSLRTLVSFGLSMCNGSNKIVQCEGCTCGSSFS